MTYRCWSWVWEPQGSLMDQYRYWSCIQKNSTCQLGISSCPIDATHFSKNFLFVLRLELNFLTPAGAGGWPGGWRSVRAGLELLEWPSWAALDLFVDVEVETAAGWECTLASDDLSWATGDT